MLKTALIAALLLLTGCAVTPQELAAQGERVEFTTRLGPTDAANCMVRNAQRRGPGGIPRMNAGEQPGSAEFHMTATYYAVIQPAAQGGRGVVWMLPVSVIDKHALWAEITKGC